MSELVGERLRALGRVEVGANGDRTSDPVGASVGGRAVTVVELEPGGANLLGERAPEALRTIATKQLWHDLRGRGRTNKRGFVEDAHCFEADEHAARHAFARRLVGMFDVEGDRCEDGEGACTFADLAGATLLCRDGLPSGV